jgi:hypothetical protein
MKHPETPSTAQLPQAQDDKQQAIAQLRKLLKPGDTVYCSLSRVARSGMSRDIKFLIAARLVRYDYDPTAKVSVKRAYPGIRNISGEVSRALALPWADGDSVTVRGCGMDMGFAAVYKLAATLFPKAETEKPPCRDSGYALKSQWL